MKKRILSCLMALALCLTLLPTAALAEETEGTAQTPPAMGEPADPANGEAKQEQENQQEQQEQQEIQPAALAAGTEHTNHPICGETDCTDHSHALPSEETWKGVSSLNEINGAGHYYLTTYVKIDSTWEPADDVVLCLNGNDIEMESDGDVITVNNGVKFTK